MNVEVFTVVSGTGDDIELVNIINEDGSFTQMPKSVYDEQQANQASGTIL